MNTILSDPFKTIIVAEAGTSHNGDPDHAERLISAAKESGADYIKFQYVIADEIVHPAVGSIKLPGGMVSIYDRFKSLETPPEFYQKLIELCKQYKIEFFCAAFGPESAENLIELGVNKIKIASPELNHTFLLKKAQSFNIPLVLSSGVSKMSDINNALRTAPNTEILLHCVTAYPAKEADYNISLLETLGSETGKKIGISDHSKDPILVPILSAAYGAVMIEKHFTLSNTTDGLDDQIALNPKDFKTMVQGVREAENSSKEEVISQLSKKYSIDKIRTILGKGIKKLTSSEKKIYKTTRRSVLAKTDISAGEKASLDNCGIYRSERNMKPGMEPGDFKLFINNELKKDLKAGQPISKKCFN